MGTAGHPIIVRRAEVEDAEAMRTLHASPSAVAGTLQVPYPSLEQWRRRLVDMADDYMLAATIDGDLVGACGLHPVSKSPRRRHVAALGLVVREDRQRRGVGFTLLQAAIALADGWLDLHRLELCVYIDNLAALALYRRFGFAIEGTAAAYAFRDGRYADVHLMARLRPALARERSRELDNED